MALEIGQQSVLSFWAVITRSSTNFAHFRCRGCRVYESRIRNSTTITPETLAAMEQRIPECTDVILKGMPLDVVAYGCTSASMVIGEERVFERIRESRPGVQCTTPITAAFAAFEALGAKNLAVLTPYRQDVNDRVTDYMKRVDTTLSHLDLSTKKMTIVPLEFPRSPLKMPRSN